MKNYISYNLNATSSMVDNNHNLRFDSILTTFQDLATLHATEMGLSFVDLKAQSNAFWVLSKIRFKLNGFIRQNDVVCCKSWPLNPTAYRFIREFKLSAGVASVLGSSEWCLLDCDTISLRKFSTVNYPNALIHIDEKSGAGDFLRLKEEISASDYNYTYKAKFTDIDCNNHVNNVSYAKMALNAFSPQEFEDYNFSEFEIQFVSQSYFGDEIKIYKKKTDFGVYVEGKLEDKTIFKTAFIK